MKNSSLIFQGLLALGLLILYILHFTHRSGENFPATPTETNQSENKEPSTDTLSRKEKPVASTESEGLLRIAYVNSDSLLENYNYYQTRQKQLEARFKQMQATFNSRKTALQQEMQNFQQSVATGTITEAAARAKQEELLKKEQQFMLDGQNLEKTLAQEEVSFTKQLNEKIVSTIEGYAKENNYDYIFGFSLSTVAAGIIYGQAEKDVTQEVLQLLNAEN